LTRVRLQQLLGDDPAVDESVHNLGLVLRAQGKLDEALPLYRELLELKSKVLFASVSS